MVTNVHPSWLAPMSAELIAHCKEQERGRRWIADLLAEWSELVNCLLNQELEAGLECDPLKRFWVDPYSDWDSLVILHLGAMVYAPLIIKIVNGKQVRLIADALGRDLYANTLKFGRNSSRKSTVPNDGFKQIDLDLDSDWLLELRLEGFKELTGFAYRRHPLLLERVKVAHDKTYSACTPLHFRQSRLQDSSIEDCIVEVIKGGADE